MFLYYYALKVHFAGLKNTWFTFSLKHSKHNILLLSGIKTFCEECVIGFYFSYYLTVLLGCLKDDFFLLFFVKVD